MGGIIIIIIGALLVTPLLLQIVIAGGTGGSSSSSCHYPGFFVNSHDCSRFYRCIDQSTDPHQPHPNLHRFDFDCPHGTVFSEGLMTCVHGGHGDCGGGWTLHHPPHHKGGGGWGSGKKGWIRPNKSGSGWRGPAKGWGSPKGHPHHHNNNKGQWDPFLEHLGQYKPGTTIVVYDPQGHPPDTSNEEDYYY